MASRSGKDTRLQIRVAKSEVTVVDNSSTLGETAHRFTRNGRELQLRVMAVAGGAEYGHVLLFGEVRDGCLVRIHSRCLYGESLGSQDCDCGPELDTALDRMWEEGGGILIYLEQEGRGSGLIAKALGYRESERRGTDTFASYESLGLPADNRTYLAAAKSLRDLGLTRVRLLTNNPAKVEQVRATGLTVTRVPLHTEPLSQRAAEYLEAKRRRRGHMIPPYGVLSEPRMESVLERQAPIPGIWSRLGPALRPRHTVRRVRVKVRPGTLRRIWLRGADLPWGRDNGSDSSVSK
ncbi:GTP cyclohydrolase II [Nocardia pseudovaccinii]|uniref:GTP cyclohydrolase II n=1 Tax=Nocardia pseudovaccinii TaxID=189540 RepID=UPI000A00F601|nr:GTP cyclohydrolase II [Nocardia pseudovaccinii]